MSEYDYYDRRDRRGKSTRMPSYIETDETYTTRAPSTRDLVIRPRDRDDDYYYNDDRTEYSGHRRARSHGRSDRYYDNNDYYSDYDDRHSRRGRGSRYDDEISTYSGETGNRDRRKSKVQDALEGFGLGGVVAAYNRSKSRHRASSVASDRSGYSRRSGRSGRSDRSHSQDTRKKWQHAATAAVATGLVEAFRSRKTPGPWTGERGQRVATAALSAAGIDGLLDRDPNNKSKRHLVESMIGGLVTNRIANGSARRSQSQSRRSRSQSRGRSGSRSRSRSRSQSVIARLRSRSRSIFGGRSPSREQSQDGRSPSRERDGRSKSRTGLKEIAAAGGIAAAGKVLYDRMRSKSRGRLDRDRSPSAASDNSYVPIRRQRDGQRDRRSVDDHDREYEPSQGNREIVPRGRNTERETGLTRAGEQGRDRSSSTSTISSTDLDKQRKKTRTKEMLTAGLASVATIHAVHGVYSSMMASKKRRKLVSEGEMSPEEARKRKSKNMLQDAAAVGIAALGIKSAFGEWKEMNESRKEKHELEARHKRHLERRTRKSKQSTIGSSQSQPYDSSRMDYGYGASSNSGALQNSNRLVYYDENPYDAFSGADLPRPPASGPRR